MIHYRWYLCILIILTGYIFPFNSQWQNRKKIKINSDSVLENLDNFPILVMLDTTNFDYTNSKADGTDIRFYDEDGETELSYQIDEWKRFGNSYLWVRIPRITKQSTNEFIYIYYNNKFCDRPRYEEGAFDSNYAGVWHMRQADGYIKDYSETKNDATYFSVWDRRGIVGRCSYMPGPQAFIEIPNDGNLQITGDLTIEGWFIFYEFLSENDFFDKSFSGEYGLRASSAGRLSFYQGDGNNSSSTYRVNNNGDEENTRIIINTYLQENVWYHLAFVRKGSEWVSSYVNSAFERQLFIEDMERAQESVNPIKIGKTENNEVSMQMAVDELRIMNKAVSQEWLKNSLTTSSAPNSFISFGNSETSIITNYAIDTDNNIYLYLSKDIDRGALNLKLRNINDQEYNITSRISNVYNQLERIMKISFSTTGIYDGIYDLIFDEIYTLDNKKHNKYVLEEAMTLSDLRDPNKTIEWIPSVLLLEKGQKKVASLYIKHNETGDIAVNIYSINGMLIKNSYYKKLNSAKLGGENLYIGWDGKDNNGFFVQEGIYIAMVRTKSKIQYASLLVKKAF